MLDSDLLNHAAHLQVFLDWCSVLQRTIKTRSADPGQLTHSLDAQAAFQRHHFLDFVVDASSPLMPLFWRRASTFCKAPLKKSSSNVLSTSTRFNWLISVRSVDSREFPGGDSLPGSKGSN